MGGSEKMFFDGPAGRLEGLWLPAGDREAPSADPPGAVVLCHPHPLHGGTMETKLVARTARRLSDAGFQTLRFNFRGVGRSEGDWDGGRGERRDLDAAIDYLLGRLPGIRLAVFGFSFGALVGLDVGSRRREVSALVAVAPPVHMLPGDTPVSGSDKPKMIVAAERDTIVDPAGLRTWFDGLADPKEFLLVPGAEHLFAPQSREVADAITVFLEARLV